RFREKRHTMAGAGLEPATSCLLGEFGVCHWLPLVADSRESGVSARRAADPFATGCHRLFPERFQKRRAMGCPTASRIAPFRCAASHSRMRAASIEEEQLLVDWIPA